MEKTFIETDPLNLKTVGEDFKMEHLLEIGPHCVTTDEIALKEITNFVFHNMHPEEWIILYKIALTFGKFDVKQIFEYFDNEDLNNTKSYRNNQEFFSNMEKELGK